MKDDEYSPCLSRHVGSSKALDGWNDERYLLFQKHKSKVLAFLQSYFHQILNIIVFVVLLLLNGIFMDASHFAGIIAVCL